MATLNLNKKKFIDEENLKTIVKIGINFGEKLNALEAETITDYNETKTYLKGEACYHDNYIYKCKSTATGEWNPDRWQLIGDDITELTKADVEAMVGLTAEEINTLSKIILDSEVRLDKTYSSSKIYTDIQNAIQTSKDYTLTELSKMSGASYKVVTSTSEMTSESIIYLLPNATNYDMYIVEEDGTATKIGDTAINLDNYFTKQEITDNYYDKATCDGKFATITTVDGKIDKTNIATSLDDTVTDEQVTSALLTKTELDKLSDSLVGIESDLDDKVDYKFVVENGSRYVEDVVTQEINNWLPNDNSSILINLKKLSGEKYANFQFICNKTDSQNWDCIVNGSNILWKINCVNGVRTIQELATVNNVKDVGVTTITPVNSAITGTIEYTVKNGICYVSLFNVKSTTNDEGLSIRTTMPKPAINCGSVIVTKGTNGNIGFVYINKGTTQLKANFYVTDLLGSCSFSYPVA